MPDDVAAAPVDLVPHEAPGNREIAFSVAGRYNASAHMANLRLTRPPSVPDCCR